MPLTRATIILSSSTHTSRAITDRLGLTPTGIRDRGDPVSRRNPKSKLREGARWLLRSGISESQPLADHLAVLLDQIEPQLPVLNALLDEGCQLEWFCYLEARPLGNLVDLDAPLLARLAALGGSITFDIYNSEPD